jgi:trk system potassium uptake protein TrkA
MSETLSTEFFARELLALDNLCRQGMSLLMIQISPVAAAAGCPVPELELPRDCVLLAVIRDERVLYPRGDTTLQPWDRVFAVVDRDAEDGLREALTRLR